MAKTVSDETQAIIDRLKREGDLIRNSGANSIRGVKVELGKFHAVFDQMKQSLSSLSSQNANAANVAKQLAQTQQNQQQQNQAQTQSQQAAQQQQDKQDKTKKEKAAKTERRERTSWMKDIKSFFGKIFGFFKTAALFLAGGALAYEFIAGYIEEKFGKDIPTLVEMIDTLKTVDWKSIGTSLAVLGGLGLVLSNFRTAMLAATVTMAVLGGMKDLAKWIYNKSRGRSPSGVPGTGPRSPGAPGGTQPTASPGINRAELRRQWAKDKSNRVVPRNTSFQDWLAMRQGGGAPVTTPTVAPGGPPSPTAAAGPGWWQKLRGISPKAPGVVGAGLTAGAVIMGLQDDDLLAPDSLEADLLASIDERRYDFEDVAADALVSAGAGAGIGIGVGSLAGGVGAIPGAIGGAISGLIWGTVTSAFLGLTRAIKDSGEGIDELPNSVEAAMREEAEAFEKGIEGREEAVKRVKEAAEEFLKGNKKELEDTVAAIQELEAKKASGAAWVGADAMQLEDLIEKRDLLQKQVETTNQVLQRRVGWLEESQFMEEERRKLEALQNGQFDAAMFESISGDKLTELLATVSAQMAPQQFFINQGGPINNFNNTSMNRSSAVAYRSNVGSINGGSGYNDNQVIPGQFA